MRVTVKDCKMTTFRVDGAGGQHRDKTSSGVRLTHEPSGAVGVGTDSRKQSENKKTAFVNLVNSTVFRTWYNKQIGVTESNVEQVTETIRTYNLVDNRVTDHRTKHKSSQVDAILDGDIDLLYK